MDSNKWKHDARISHDDAMLVAAAVLELAKKDRAELAHRLPTRDYQFISPEETVDHVLSYLAQALEVVSPPLQPAEELDWTGA